MAFKFHSATLRPQFAHKYVICTNEIALRTKYMRSASMNGNHFTVSVESSSGVIITQSSTLKAWKFFQKEILSYFPFLERTGPIVSKNYLSSYNGSFGVPTCSDRSDQGHQEEYQHSEHFPRFHCEWTWNTFFPAGCCIKHYKFHTRTQNITSWSSSWQP